MWSSSHGARALSMLALIGVLPVAGCGFHPLYGNHQATGLDTDLAAIKVNPVPERIGQMVVIALRGALNPSGARVDPRYNLTVIVATSVGDFAIRKDGTPSRELYGASASFSLQDLSSQKIVLTGSARANDSYDVGANPFTTIVANQDADKKAAQSMSEQIESQIAVFLRRRAAAPP
jgi:LPS-assembly lipoprotein